MTYLLRKFDDQRPTHILKDVMVPPGEIWQCNGWLLVPAELAARLEGEPDTWVNVNGIDFPAWTLPPVRDELN